MSGSGLRIVPSDGGDVVIASGPYPGAPVLRIPAAGMGTNGGPGSLLYGESTTPPNPGAGVLLFAFDPPVAHIITVYVDGIALFPNNSSVSDGGVLLDGSAISPPSGNVTALYVSR